MGTPDRIGRYRVERVLGQGGMGIVYAARDEQLDRVVAVKTLLATQGDEALQKRFWREARTAASVNHPNVCHIHEVGVHQDAPFIAMELLEGESLASRLSRGSLPLPEALQVARGVLSALDALHRRDIVHRDLKPSNIFLTPHGVKLLDFGLARPSAVDPELTASLLTQPGTVLGTPRYMSPEQLRGEPAEARSDLFAVGVILFEMLSGRPAFPGRTPAEVFHATLHEQPPALTGSPAIAAADLVIRRALAKRPADRQASAAAMVEDLQGVSVSEDTGAVPRARAMTRLIVLPLRMLRPDTETDFLAFSVPDAVTSAIGGLESLVVRSSLMAQRFAGDSLDLRRIASEAEVDLVLSGTLLRAGDQIRVTAQLVEAPSGALVWSHTATHALTDVFRLQDVLVTGLVESLALPLTAREHRMLRRDVPQSATAYEYYLRANKAALETASWDLAQQLYERCLGEDQGYAPAWARLARIYRIRAKFDSGSAEQNLRRAGEAFARALELNPDSALVHNLYTHFEVEAGRAMEAMVRLLGRAGAGAGDPELFAGLVTASRYCGLLEASLAADRHARRLDPGVRTSVAYTHWMLGDYERAAALDAQELPYVRWYSAVSSGLLETGIAAMREAVERTTLDVARRQCSGYLAALEGRREDALAFCAMELSPGFRDPEGLYFIARLAAYVDAPELALGWLERVVEGGFTVPTLLAGDPWLEPVRAHPEFRRLLARASERSRTAAEAFRAADGERLLGVSV